MKRCLQTIVVLFAASCALYGANCSPTTPIEKQSRTDMKHRPATGMTASATTVTIQQMLEWPNPTKVDRNANSPIDPRENNVFTVQGDLWRAKMEDNDCDFHLELTFPGQGPDADRVIVEIPQDPAFAPARDAIVQALVNQGEGNLNSKKSIDLSASIPIEVTGLAFFDAFHFSQKNPKRGHGHGTEFVGTLWELHPAGQVRILSGAPAGAAHAEAAAATPPTTPARGGAAAPSASTAAADEEPDAGDAFDFAITRPFLTSLENGRTILPTFNVTLGGHSKIHPLNQDCEMHVAAKLQSPSFGSPDALVIEPPNLCMIDPDGNESDEVGGWLSVFDNVEGAKCQASGFPRIFTEHVSGGTGPSNPDHVFELHPAVSISCEGDTPRSFASFVKIFPGMRAIKPTSLASCLENRKLEVKFDRARQRYLFHENGGTCGNFAEIVVDRVLPDTVRAPKGGHSAIVRVALADETEATLKIYTLAGSDIDAWLAAVRAQTIRNSSKGLHGIITYDYFALIKALHPKGATAWKEPADWTPVNFPLAFVVFGESATQPDQSGEQE